MGYYEEEPHHCPPPPCPACGGVMQMARLKNPGMAYTYVEMEQEEEDNGAPARFKERNLLLDAWICIVCGHVELHAHIHPEPDEDAENDEA